MSRKVGVNSRPNLRCMTFRVITSTSSRNHTCESWLPDLTLVCTERKQSARKPKGKRFMQRLLHTTISPPVNNPKRVTHPSAPVSDARTLCAHEVIEAQAMRTTDAAAVVCDELELSYEQLNARANQLAHELMRVGVGPDSLVGICIERSAEMVVAILATLKAGGAYVPLDPTYPHDRLAFMLDDARVSVLLTQSKLVEILPKYDGIRVCLDTDWTLVANNSTENPQALVHPDNLAYVIYTSGSTGQPKGAMITHHGLTNYLNWATEAYQVREGCGALVHSSISFDLTVTSLFAPLMAGCSVFLLPDGIEALAAALTERTNYSLLKITPAHLRALTELLPPDSLAGRVRALIIGGEALHFESLSLWREHAPQTRIINEYGPTETVVGCSVYEVSADDPAFGPVPIGQPIAKTELHVLRENFERVSSGEIGELFIGGDGVARGYLNREALTTERFIPNPFGDGLLYRTGDLARIAADGNFEYLGRVDDQVKIRGFRIELGEIETVLKQHEAISDCAVIAKEEASGEKRLLTFVVSNQIENVDAAKLVLFLKTKLPDYMIPAAFIQLKELPLTINGKVDRAALADYSRSAAEADQVGPRNAIEEKLATIWSEVLSVKSVSINDNFFDLGGDSILGTLILARAARAGLKISPTQLFEYQTIAELATVAGGALHNAPA